MVKIANYRAANAYYNNNSNAKHQPTAENNFPEVDPNNPHIDDRTREDCEGYGTLVSALQCKFDEKEYDIGLNYDWSKPKQTLPRHMNVENAK